jgi:hypothetical protein
MSKWKTRDVAYFELNPSSGTTIIGKLRCAICAWSVTPTTQFPFPALDEYVEKHLAELHPDLINDAGVQKIPRDDVREMLGENFGDADLIYFVLLDAH